MDPSASKLRDGHPKTRLYSNISSQQRILKDILQIRRFQTRNDEFNRKSNAANTTSFDLALTSIMADSVTINITQVAVRRPAAVRAV